MIKIWAKIITENKIVKQYVFNDTAPKMDYSKFLSYLVEICYNLDIATPILMKTHIFNYAKYNYVKFTASDFVENINFDKLIVENINH